MTRPRNAQPRLLLVDDDEAFLESMEYEFTDRGYKVLPAPDYRAALGLAAMHQPAFAVVDLRLRGEGGLRVLSDLIDRLPGIRSVVLTGYGSIATAVEATKLGAFHYLTKPCDPDELEKAFRRDAGDATTPIPDYIPSLALHEREYIEYVLAATGGNISEAARRLGLHRQSLQRKLRKYPPRR